MTTDSTTPAEETTLFLGKAWSDPIEAAIRDRIRVFIEELIEEEPAAALGRGRYQRRHRRGVAPGDGHRHGHRRRRLCGSFGTVEIAVPRARIVGAGSETFEMGEEVAAALAAAGMHDELARNGIIRTQHRDLLRLSRRGHPQIGARLRPGAGERGMHQRLALVPIEQNDVAGFGLLLAQLQTQADPFDLGGNLPAFQRVPRTPPPKLFCAAPWTIASG